MKHTIKNFYGESMPDAMGYFGEYGGSFVPPVLEPILEEITSAYLEVREDHRFYDELQRLHEQYTGRPSPVYKAKNLTERQKGARIYLKREDLNHTGAHKINHCLGEALLAKRMGKKKLIAETGAGQHGVALATVAALLGLECDIYMGEVDMAKERPNVLRMQILGARVVPVSHGLKTLKEAVDSAFEAYVKDPENQFYAIGSVVGPHPFPMMVRDFQGVIGREAKQQMQSLTGELPQHVVACVGGGSNAMGIFSAFLEEDVALHGVEPSGTSFKMGEHAATLTLGTPGIVHGFRTYVLQDKTGDPAPVNTIASGLDYPGVGPQHAYLKEQGRVAYHTISDDEALEAFHLLARHEGIIPALESAHAIAYGLKLAAQLSPEESILINLSGRGDKDIDYVMERSKSQGSVQE